MRTIMIAFLLLASIPLFATPSTLVTIPSTDIQPVGVWHLGMDTVGNNAGAFADLGLTYGVTPRIEAGIDLITGTDDLLWANGKIQLLSPNDSPVAVAAGIYNAGTVGATNQSVLYAVGSTTLAGTRLTAGGYSGREEGLAGDGTGVLLGLDRTIGKWWLGADYASGKNAIGSWNVGVGYALTENIGVIVGYDNYNANGVSDTVNFQLDVNL